MKGIFLFVTIFLWAASVQAQEVVELESGKKAVLYDNFTWNYLEGNKAKQVSGIYKKSKNTNFLLKSKKMKIGVWLNRNDWKFKKPLAHPAEYQFQYKNSMVHGFLITEKTQIPIEDFKFVALENGKEAAKDLRITKTQYREVNGIKLLYIEMLGTVDGLKIVFRGYYYSNSSGSVQLVTFTAAELAASYKAQQEELLNGLVKIQ